MAEMTIGQMFRIGLTCLAEHERCELELVLVANSAEDAKTKLPWVFDFSDWSSYRIDWTVKEPGRCRVLKQKFERIPENEPDSVIKRDDGSQAMFQRVGEQGGKKYEIKAQTVLYAKSPDAAKKKIASRILGGSELINYQIEEVAAPSSYATARDVSVFKRASFVRG